MHVLGSVPSYREIHRSQTGEYCRCAHPHAAPNPTHRGFHSSPISGLWPPVQFPPFPYLAIQPDQDQTEPRTKIQTGRRQSARHLDPPKFHAFCQKIRIGIWPILRPDWPNGRALAVIAGARPLLVCGFCVLRMRHGPVRHSTDCPYFPTALGSRYL